MFKRLFHILLFLCCFWNQGKSQINCDFTHTSVTGCGSFGVDFCDMSTSTAGPIVGWSWNMEVSAFSVECPSTVFSQPGIYTVCLTVTDSEGNTCTTCKDDLVQVYNLPNPAFEADIIQGCTPLEVTYTDLSQGADGEIVDWFWGLGGSCGSIVGDGTNPVATCTYTIPGSYNISLIITDDNGCVNTINKVSYINVAPQPEIDIAAVDSFGCTAPHDITFVNNGDLANINYVWDFGNNQSFEGPIPPTITYDSPGAYDVTVVATDQVSGCTDTLTLQNYITIGFPASFSYTPEDGCEDLLVSFTDESAFAAQSVLWDFGDGNTSAAANPNHLYTAPGCYTVQLTRLVDGCTSVAFAENCINVDPKPDVFYVNDTLAACTLPHIVNFAGISNTAVEWFWDFGDGNTSDQQFPTHTYDSFGEFPVVLTVTNAFGCTNDTLINTVRIIELEGQLADVFTDGCVPLNVNLEENATTASPITSWMWEATNGTNIFTSNEENPTFSIIDTGVYDITLIIENTLGCIDTAFFSGAIEAGFEPEINFEATPLESCIDEPIQFTDLTPGDVDEWFWDFGDGGTEFIENPEYVYTDTGFYTVSLLVENNGCFSQLTFEDYIHALAPLARFEVTNFCENFLYKEFINNAIGADSTYWDFGVDNVTTDTTSLTNPSFVFPESGVYTVTQQVFNFTTMCSHTTSIDVMVTDPVADFSLLPLEGCLPLVISATDLSIDAVSWQWSSLIGIVSDDTLSSPTITYFQPGLFINDITLIVTDVNECNDTLTFAEPISANASEANFTSDVTTGCAPLTVSFTDLSENNFFADVVAWNWNFGPGLGTSDLQNPVFTFENIGAYDVTLTVTDTWGCNNTITLTDYVDVTLPVAGFELDSLGCTNNDVNFESTSSGWQLNYSWDFGDNQNGTGPNPVHQYLTEGTFTTCVTITDGYGCTDFTCKEIIVADPFANFSVDSTFASCPPLPVNFTNLSINANTYLWDFGDDNAPSDFENPLYSYLTPGVFDVTLIAIRTETCRDTLLIEELIVLDGPVGEYTVSIDSTCTPAEVTFVGTSPEAYTYYWDFGEGVIDSSATPVLYDSVTYVYNSPGTFTPTLSLLNSTGCFRTLPVVSTVYVAEINADFEASKIAVCNDDPAIAFTPLIDATEPITAVEWYFENGIPASSTLNNPISNFNIPGNHDVTLIMESQWCRDTIIKENYIGVGESPVASFIMDFDEGCGPHTITFTDMSTVSAGTIEAWNWDFGDGTTSTVQNPVHVFEADLDILISLEVVTDAGCVDNYFNNATVFPLTDIDAGASPTVCIGEPTQLQGTINADTSQVEYYWEPAAGLSCSDCLDPWVLNPTDTIVYTLVVIGPEGCPAEADVTVFVRPYEVPNLVLPADETICADDLTQIVVEVTNNVDVFTYQWDTTAMGLSCYNNCFNPVASPEVSTNYTVTVTTSENCSSTDSVYITVEDLYQPFTGPDKTICEGDSIALDASFGENPEWLIATDLTCAYCPNPMAFPDTTTTYIVSVTTTSGCLVIDTIVVNTLAADEVGAGEDFAICLGEVTDLQGYGPGQISWTPAVNLSDPTIERPMATPTSDTEYIITAVNGDCIFKDSVFVAVNTKTELESTDHLICEGEEIVLNVNGFADEYLWTPGEELSDPFAANPLASPVENTDYTVFARLGLCEPDTAFVFIEVIPAPEFYMSSTRYYLEGQAIQLDVRLLEDGNYTYQWSPAIGLSCTDCDRPSLSPTEDIVYTLTLTDEDTGCSFDRSVSVERLTSCAVDLIGVPNAFSPNDDGINDVLQLNVSPTIPEVRKFSVYNRWGGLVFSANNQFESWDGTYKGQKLQEGVYVYFLEYVCALDGKVLMKKGDITLLR